MIHCQYHLNELGSKKGGYLQRNIKSIIGFSMGATDGEIGKVEEFYFDDTTWIIRYLVVQTGSWLSDRKVLISPEAFVKTSWESGIFPVNLTKEQIHNSPDIDTDKPISRKQEIALYEHYPWKNYWWGAYYSDGFSDSNNSSPGIDQKIAKEAANSDKQSEGDLHLRSTQRVTGYHIHATDGEIGHINDFIIDDQTWQLVYLVVDTHNWLGGKKVLMPVEDIKEVQWDNFRVLVNVNIDSVKNSKPFDQSEFDNFK